MCASLYARQLFDHVPTSRAISHDHVQQTVIEFGIWRKHHPAASEPPVRDNHQVAVYADRTVVIEFHRNRQVPVLLQSRDRRRGEPRSTADPSRERVPPPVNQRRNIAAKSERRKVDEEARSRFAVQVTKFSSSRIYQSAF